MKRNKKSAAAKLLQHTKKNQAGQGESSRVRGGGGGNYIVAIESTLLKKP